MKYHYKIIALLLLALNGICQHSDPKNNLAEILKLPDADTTKTLRLCKISLEFMQDGANDSAFKFAMMADKFAKAQPLSAQARANYVLGQVYYQKSSFKESIEKLLTSAKQYETLKRNLKIAACYNIIALAYHDQNLLDMAENYHLKNLKIRVDEKDSVSLAGIYSNLGLNYYQRASRLTTEKVNSKELNQAHEYFQKSLNLAKRFNLDAIIANVYGNLSLIMSTKQDFNTAIKYAMEAKAIYVKDNDTYQEGVSNLDLASIYNAQGKLQEALGYVNAAMKIAHENKYSEIERYALMNLIDIKEKSQNFKDAFFYQKKLKAIEDTLFQTENLKQVNEMQVKFESEKKETENKLLTAKNELAANSIKNQKFIIIFIMLGLAFTVGVAIFIFKGLKKQKLANTIISQQKVEVENKNVVIEQQKHLVEEKQKEIVDSINYAKRIQQALLAHEDFLKNNLQDHFVYFNPKDIVSGDFYWAANYEGRFYLAVCDSTGHGVPGAFMSLLNIGFLSEAINEKGIVQPDKIFNHVRQRLIENISKEGQKDGFDGILLCIDRAKNHISYSAANNAPLLIRNGSLIELEADRMPVGMGERKEDFKLHTIDFKQDDTLFLYTDGYADQFGGPKGKKFKYKQLNELLTSNNHKPLEQQKKLLDQEFMNWRGDLEQVDDVCIIGIRL